MTSREVQVGDRYYCGYARAIFTVVHENIAETGSWLMSSGDDGYTIFMHESEKDWHYAMLTGPDFEVIVGSTWFSIGHNDLFEVVRDNANRETGPDSWEMKGEHTGKTFYMHHNQRVRGSWLHVSVGGTLNPIPVVRRSRYHRNPVI
jgi:hypothetical protein